MDTSTATTPTLNSKIRRLQSANIPRSPRLSRSSSGTSNVSLSEIHGLTTISPQQSINRASSVSLPEIQALGSRQASPRKSVSRASRSATTSPRPSVHRSRSTTKCRGTSKEKEKEDENYSNIPISKGYSSPQRRLSLDSKGGHINNNAINQSNVAKLFRSSSHNMTIRGAGQSLTRSPSAWALSPGRLSPALPLALESPKVKGVSGVLKYFKHKKVSSAEEEEYHQCKIMYTTLLQWRFANAKAEVAMSKVKRKAEERLFGVWLKLYKMRYAIAEKRMKVERLKQKIKLLQIICPQIDLLNEWEKLEKKNCEAIGRVTRKLSAYSTKLPLVNGATGNIASLFDAMKLSLEVMENIEDTITNFHLQAENLCNMLRELIYTVEQSIECFPQLEKEIARVMSLEAREKSLLVHLIQENKEPEEGQSNCKHHLIRSFRRRDNGFVYSMLNVS